MPIKNLFKNCSYYYGFAAYVAYFVNHPKYTAPPEWLSMVCFALAVLAQLSNLRWGCHAVPELCLPCQNPASALMQNSRMQISRLCSGSQALQGVCGGVQRGSGFAGACSVSYVAG